MPRQINSGLAEELHAAALASFEKWARVNSQSSNPDDRIRSWLALDLMQRVKDLEVFEKEIQRLMFPVLYACESALAADPEDGEDPDNVDYVEQFKRTVTSIVHSQNALATEGAPLMDAWLTPEAIKVAYVAHADGRGGSFSEEVMERVRGGVEG